RHFLPLDSGGFEIRNGRAHHEHVTVTHRAMNRVMKFVARHDRNKFRADGRRDACGSGDQLHVVSRRDGGFRDRVAHFSRRTVAEEADGINRLARGAGSDDEPHAIKLSWRASRNSARKAMSSTFHKRPMPSYPHASIPSSGPMNSTPRVFSVATFSCVAGCSHIFPFMAGASKIGARVASAMAASG